MSETLTDEVLTEGKLGVVRAAQRSRATGAGYYSSGSLHQFETGDIVHIEKVLKTVVRIRPIIDGTVSSWSYSLPLKSIGPYAGEGHRPRMLGEKPEVEYEGWGPVISQHDPRIAWLYEDIEAYASTDDSVKRAWRTLCEALDIPGVVRTFRIEVEEGVNITISARSNAEAKSRSEALLKKAATRIEESK